MGSVCLFVCLFFISYYLGGGIDLQSYADCDVLCLPNLALWTVC